MRREWMYFWLRQYTYFLQTRDLDSGLPYTDGERVISAGALARLTLLNLQYKVNYLHIKKFKLRGSLDPTPRKL